MGEARSIHAKEEAAMIRAALKKRFPATKFSVRMKTFSMGSSVDVEWTDGPTVKRVQEITGPYEGKGFDGMTDSTTYRKSWLLADGRVTTPAGLLELTDPPIPEGMKVEAVQFYAWIHTRREISQGFRDRIVLQLIDFYGAQPDHQEIEKLIRQASEDATKFSKAHFSSGRIL